MNNKKILKVIFFLIISIIFFFSNYKNNTLQKFKLGANEIILHKIRTDQNIFSGTIFYPKGIEEVRTENDILNLNDFNLNLKSLISDKNLYENAASELILGLDKKYKLYKIDRRENFTKIFLSGKLDEIEDDINLITKNYNNFLFKVLNSKIENFENYIKKEDILFYQFNVKDRKNNNLIFLFFTILMMLLAILSLFEILKLLKNKDVKTD